MTLRARLRSVRHDTKLTIAATIGVLLVVVPLIVLIAVVATGNATGGGIAAIAVFLAAGVWVLIDLLAGVDPNLPPPPVALDPGSTRGQRGTGFVALVTIGMLVVIPLAIAVVMSGIDDRLRNDEPLAFVVVGILVLGVLALVGGVVRWLARRDRTS